MRWSIALTALALLALTASAQAQPDPRRSASPQDVAQAGRFAQPDMDDDDVPETRR